MNWGRPTDYHGSRSYGAEERPAGKFRHIAAWLANVGAGKLWMARSSAAGRQPSMILPSEGERGFSRLGAAHGGNPLARAADCPFPIKPDIIANDWRVLP